MNPVNKRFYLYQKDEWQQKITKDVEDNKYMEARVKLLGLAVLCCRDATKGIVDILVCTPSVLIRFAVIPIYLCMPYNTNLYVFSEMVMLRAPTLMSLVHKVFSVFRDVTSVPVVIGFGILSPSAYMNIDNKRIENITLNKLNPEEKIKTGFDALVGLEDVKKQLQVILDICFIDYS